jgi:hypothetical protein
LKDLKTIMFFISENLLILNIVNPRGCQYTGEGDWGGSQYTGRGANASGSPREGS